MKNKNEMTMNFDADSVNEGFARLAVAAFAAALNPTLDELADIKTAVSEAVTNSIIHGYDGREGKVYLGAKIEGRMFSVSIRDEGKGIADINKARQPFYTTRPELERSGRGFAFMEAFMDEVYVESEQGKGTTIIMKKTIGRRDE